MKRVVQSDILYWVHGYAVIAEPCGTKLIDLAVQELSKLSAALKALPKRTGGQVMNAACQ